MLVIIGLLLSFLLLLWQDWKFRRIHIVLPVLVFTLSIIHSKNTVLSIIANGIFFGCIFAFLVLYMSLKAKKFLNPFEHYFGLGDMLFFLAVTPLFLLRQYALFFITSMIFSILMHIVFSKFYKQPHIPLAGYSSLLLAIIIVFDLSFNLQKITLI